MLFIVKGKSHNEDRILRIHANDEAEAEAIGWKRGIFVTEVTQASAGEASNTLDRVAQLVWKAWRYTPVNNMRVLGRSVSRGQAAALIVLGLGTWILDLHHLGFVRF